MKRLFLGLLTLFALLFSGVACASGVNRALLIGCDRFVTWPNTAQACAGGARAMQAMLESSGTPFDVIDLWENGLSGREALTAVVRAAFRDAEEGDTAWIYIATHGALGEDGQTLSLVLSDGVTEEEADADFLRALLDTVPGKKVLILDACHSGAAIGKGGTPESRNAFAGEDYLVLCSGGALEDSYLWSDGSGAGSGYFTAALVNGVSGGGWGADANWDGSITLAELEDYVLRNCGVSTPRCYPEQSGQVLLLTGETPEAYLSGLSLETETLAGESPAVSFSYTLRKHCRIRYRLVYSQGDAWDFDGAELIRDGERMLQPGKLRRTITFRRTDEEGGWVLLLITAEDRSGVHLLSSRVLTILPLSGSPELSLYTAEAFSPADGEELAVFIRHDQPMVLTVTVVDEEGNRVARLCTNRADRPEGTGGTTLYWSGLKDDGTPAPEGSYRVQVKASAGEISESVESGAVRLEGPLSQLR